MWVILTMNKTTVELRMSGVTKILYAGVVICGFLFAFGCLALLMSPEESLSAEETIAMLAGIVFFGGGSMMVTRLMVKPAGTIEIDEHGLTFDTYATIGVVPWSNFVEAGTVRILGAGYVGIRLRELSPYLDSKRSFDRSRRRTDQALTQWFTRFLLSLKSILPMKLLDGAVSLLGWSGMPKSAKEEDLYAWNRQNFNYHLLIQSFWFRDVDQFLKWIDDFKPAHHDETTKPNVLESSIETVSPDIEPGYKKCPMCAETIKLDAKICRYCRYSFEEQTFV